MQLPRHGEIWLPSYLRTRLNALMGSGEPAQRVWLAIADHYEPFWNNADVVVAKRRVADWRQQWPQIAARHRDSAGRRPAYTFYYPAEEYHPDLLDPLAELTRDGIGDVEVHIHHNREGEADFVGRMELFLRQLRNDHGLLREWNGRAAFGFIHGNWALDNSLPGGAYCGLNNELTLLSRLGCYADFTMPSGDSPSQARMVNQIYWARDDQASPKSYDRGIPLQPGAGVEGDILMIPGPLGIRWVERMIPRLEAGELAGYDLPTPYRVRRWLDVAPRIGGDVFIKLFAHGTQERNSEPLLNGGLDLLFESVHAECMRRHLRFFYVSTWQMRMALEAIRLQENPEETALGQQ